MASFLQVKRFFIGFKEDSGVLISFREWLHSYILKEYTVFEKCSVSSHLFQRVASFLLPNKEILDRFIVALFSSLSESGFIPTRYPAECPVGYHFFVLISFREWLHSYIYMVIEPNKVSKPMFSSLSESGFIPTIKRIFSIW